MPIYFNAVSHLWIGCLFIANGLMLTWLLRSKFESFRSFTQPLEAQVLSGFFISLGLNGLILLLLNSLSLDFSLAKWPLGLIGFGQAALVYAFIVKLNAYHAFRFEINIARFVLYLFVFVVLFYNGGLIDKVSDSWWHMSLANKIALEGTYSPAVGHLIGLPTRYYPPLWHGNLALANQLSGISIAVFWNSLTAWVAVFKVMAFYLFAYGISKNKTTGVLAAMLFVVLPGVGVSYLRVSAWPSHIAYTAWYAMFYVFALFLDGLPPEKATLRQAVSQLISTSGSKLITLLFLSVIIFFTHKAEIVWFVVAWFSYLIAASLSRSLSTGSQYIIARDHFLLLYCYRAILILIAIFGVWFAVNHRYLKTGLSDQLLANLLPVVLSVILLLLDIRFKSKMVLVCIWLVLLALIFGSVNYTHLYSLFVPEFALQAGQFYESSAVAIGYFGDELKIPSWHLQLRSGLLYSGVLSVIVAVVLLIVKPNRLSILTAGTGCVAMLFCASPYLYHWLQGVLNYHSTWRISLMVFHPIVWAFALVTLNEFRKTLADPRA
ncbi:MAG: hypothetical protein JKX81_05420 [Arenicella sp.]|nr:hypothetical protein [Arenicella sp.]